MEWRPLAGFEGLYEISSDGRIMSFKYNKRKILKKRIGSQGYYSATLYKNNKQYTVKVNRCVALAFIPNPDNKPFVNHINGIKDDNRVENLEWVTHRENMEHKYGKSNRRKFTVEDIENMYQMTKNGYTLKQICEHFNFKNKSAVYSLLMHFHPKY